MQNLPRSLTVLFSLLSAPLLTHAAPQASAPARTVAAVPTTIQITGAIEKPLTLSRSQVERLAPVQTIQTTLKGQPITARGVSLTKLIMSAKLRLNPKVKHSEAGFVVVARGRDGYSAAFAWPELMEEVGRSAVYLVWEVNGHPLPAQDGPFRLVVPSDKKPMRWVHSLSSLRVIDAAKS